MGLHAAIPTCCQSDMPPFLTLTPSMETEIVRVVGRLKAMEVPLLRQLDVNVEWGYVGMEGRD